MIFTSFAICVIMFLIFAAFAGDVSTFINLDSIMIVFVGFLLSSMAVGVGRYKVYFIGLKQIFRFKPVERKSSEFKNMITAVSIMTVAVGIGSTAQGLISTALIENQQYTVAQIVSFSMFTTVYSIIFVALLLIPLIFLNKE